MMLIIFKKYHDLPTTTLVKAQRSFLSGICASREFHGPKVKVTAPPIKKTEVRNSQGFSFEVRKIPRLEVSGGKKGVLPCTCLNIDSIFTWIVTRPCGLTLLIAISENR
jgi:hypothetical protein